MPRARNIKPSFFKNEYLAELEPKARLLYIGLWCLADREGRLCDRPKRIKAELFPYEDCDVDGILIDLHNAGFVIRYEIERKKYIQVVNFLKHQNPYKSEKASEIPPAPADASKPIAKVGQSIGKDINIADPRCADSCILIPDSFSTDSLLSSKNDDNATSDDPQTEKRKVFENDSVQMELARCLRNLILVNLPNARVPPDTQKGLLGWCKDIDLMIRVDKRDPQDIKELICWSQSDPFWKSNILSPGKLRKQYDRLTLQRGERPGNIKQHSRKDDEDDDWIIQK
jgi:hypothetical protein